MSPEAAAELVAAWREAGPKLWFARNPTFDAMLRERFEALHLAVARGDADGASAAAEVGLARVLLLDQIPRNLWRDTAHAYATDPLARAAADQALERGWDQEVEPALRPFFYMPYEHAEDAALQARAVALFERWAAEHGDPTGFVPYARIHQEVIARFGRFPQRNRALGRATTPEEQVFLDQGGFAGLRRRGSAFVGRAWRQTGL